MWHLLTGISCGSANQVCPLQRTVQQLSNQAFLHIQYSYHSPECPCLQPLCHISDVGRQVQRKFPHKLSRRVGCEFTLLCHTVPKILPYYKALYYRCSDVSTSVINKLGALRMWLCIYACSYAVVLACFFSSLKMLMLFNTAADVHRFCQYAPFGCSF